jgi:hypothetical protein
VSPFKLTFFDKDGAVSIPEIVATLHGVVNIGAVILITIAFVRDVWIQGHDPNYVAYATAVAALVAGAGVTVAALGAAQRMRDGVCKPDGGIQ